MFKKLLIASVMLAVTSSVAFAAAPYVGVGLGVRNNTSSVSNYRAGQSNVFAGYGTTFNQSFYVAGEVFGEGTLSTFNDNSISGQSIRSSYGYGLSVIPGIMISDHSMGYVRAGVVRSRFNNQNAFATGGQVGLGLQTSLTPCWDVRGEYIYTAYRSVSSVVGSPNADQFNLALAYKFE